MMPATVSRRVLVIDDDMNTAETLALLLKQMGHEVRFAVNGVAAMQIANGFSPDVVFVDLAMPEMDGYEVALKIRALRLNAVRIFAITGMQGDEHRQRCIAAGFNSFLVKPIDPELLRRLSA